MIKKIITYFLIRSEPSVLLYDRLMKINGFRFFFDNLSMEEQKLIVFIRLMEKMISPRVKRDLAKWKGDIAER